MPISVKISLCKITAASKLFQRNYYVPLAKPLSPSDAMRKKIMTGQNVLGNRIEHYIPVLTTQTKKSSEKHGRPKGVPIIKKRCRKKENERYLEPSFDDNMENHGLLENMLRRKPKGKNRYIYEIPDKKCTLVVSSQMEKAIRDREIVDLIIAQRSDKIVFKLNNGLRVTVPLANYQGTDPMYRGSGWTKENIEQEHHHGRETMSIAKLFEAKESGKTEGELEMMRMANTRKKKVKGDGNKDLKLVLTNSGEDMDWNKYEEDSNQIVDGQEQVNAGEEDIPMAVDDMELTKNVGEKLMIGGSVVTDQLPTMEEIPEVIKLLETGDMCEMLNVSGVKVKLASRKVCFVVGQMVKSDDAEVFVPGQTVEDENGGQEYTPGITIFMEDDVALVPGLVMGEEETAPMFMPGESTITEDGQLKFESTDLDEPREARELSPTPPPSARRKKEEEIVIKRRVFDEPEEPVPRERVKVRLDIPREPTPPLRPRDREEYMPQSDILIETLELMEEERRKRDKEELRRHKDRMEEKQLKEENKVDNLRLDIRKKIKDLKIEKPKAFVPAEPVKKSAKLIDMEKSIVKGAFFEEKKTKAILERARSSIALSKCQSAMSFGSDLGRGRY